MTATDIAKTVLKNAERLHGLNRYCNVMYEVHSSNGVARTLELAYALQVIRSIDDAGSISYVSAIVLDEHDEQLICVDLM